MNYLIWSFEHNAWWKPNTNGYTKDVRFAGVYDAQLALEIVSQANYGRIDEAMVPLTDHLQGTLALQAREICKGKQ